MSAIDNLTHNMRRQTLRTLGISLTEPVAIWTNWPEPHQLGIGHLVVGADSLPELDTRPPLSSLQVRPATAPHTWYLTPLPGKEAGILLWAWRTIQEVQTRIAEAEQDADYNEAIDRARDRMIETRINQELDEEDP